MSKTTSSGTTLRLVETTPQPEAHDRSLVEQWRRHAVALLIASRTVTLSPSDRMTLVSDLRMLTGELGRSAPRMDLISVLMDIVHETFRTATDVPASVAELISTWPTDVEPRAWADVPPPA